MKTYCKPATVNIEDWHFNEIAVVECFRNKRSRKDFQRLLCKTGKITKREIVEDQLNKDFTRTLEAESEVAKMLTQRIINRDLQLKPIRQFQRIDGLTQKLRDICQESPEQQVFEYIGVYALKPLFRAKILPIQYGSIPNKGGVAGKRKIERLLRKKFHGKVVALKGDVTKAYPSVTVPIVMEMLRRDIGKNKVLLWFLGALMSNYPGNHLCIGGYLPAWLFNYVMSYCGNGKLVHASINEKGTVTGGKSGDQTGREICIRSYYNKPWIHVYRYTGVTASASGTVNVRNYLQKGDSGDAVKEMQKMLIGCGFSCGSSGVDGSFGGDTEKALLAFQAFYGLEQDGKYGPASKSKLVSAYNGKTAASVPEKKNTPSYTAGHEYTLQVELKVRTGPGTNYSAKKHSQLTADGQKHDKDNDGCLDAGTVVTCQEVRNVGNDIWMKAPSGWMAAYYDGKVYIK